MSDAKAKRRPGKGWRRWLYDLHRDAGFLVAGLVFVYVVSGIAVNHREHWDFNSVIEERTEPLASPAELLGLADDPREPGVLARDEEAALVAAIGKRLRRSQVPFKQMWRGPDRLSLLYGVGGKDVVDYFPSTGEVEHQKRRDRFLFRALNYLHLNEGRGAWTWLADVFALLLFFLAASGLVMVKARRGWRSRAGVLLALGIVLPFVALALMR
ncbi:MAG: PepSY-associated TM helix domain-containing protein [Deltaproteobacteria bacterium]|nr:PepSY-associated TM helix domain-containing protein [Deltaproteobacteria bacterium]